MPEVDFDNGLGEGRQIEKGQLQAQLVVVLQSVRSRVHTGLVDGVDDDALDCPEQYRNSYNH